MDEEDNGLYMSQECIKKPLKIPNTINTNNDKKFQEFSALFLKRNKLLIRTNIDLPEINATPLEVIVYKASHIGNNVLVEDTSLDVEGADIGVNVKWLLQHLQDLKGRRAVWRVLLAFRQDDIVLVYEGKIKGEITDKAGNSEFGFDPFFLPEGRSKTLAQEKPEVVNARALAVDALFRGLPLAIQPIMKTWSGPWQEGREGAALLAAPILTS
jgi:XTP/dITP diphosphohydrolase